MNRKQKRTDTARRRKSAGSNPSLAEAIGRAISLHRTGRLPEAEQLYRRILTASPDHADALHFLGVLMHQQGGSEEAITLIQRAIALKPDYVDAHSNLGNVYKEMGNLKNASKAYEACLALDPSHANALNNLGVVLNSQKRYSDAIPFLEHAIRHYPGHGEAHLNLGNAFKSLARNEEAERAYRQAIALKTKASVAYTSLGRMLTKQKRLDEAAALFNDWLKQDPDNPTAQHLAAAYSGTSAPPRAPDGYVSALFDDFAGSFDVKLKQLGYRGPKLVARAVKRLHGRKYASLDILDAGCGTGLVAPLIQRYAKRLVGVDLSGAMIDKARAQERYDDLHVGELTRFMDGHREQYDLVVSVDTLCYFGALEEVLSAANKALRAGGQLVFTVEKILEPIPGESFRLNPHGRYSHTQEYVEESLRVAGLSLHSSKDERLRKESGVPVTGILVIASKE